MAGYILIDWGGRHVCDGVRGGDELGKGCGLGWDRWKSCSRGQDKVILVVRKYGIKDVDTPD